MQTEITRLLGIKYPIIQGGMAWVAEHHLAAAVSEAGGLGLIMLGHIIGVGIGTVICVFTIGNTCQFVDDHFGHLYRKVYNPLGIVD